MFGRVLKKFVGLKGTPPRGDLTVSVVTPSYNQAEFLGLCLSSVASQSVRPIEHLVYDPGSSDASRDIAGRAEGVMLVAGG